MGGSGLFGGGKWAALRAEIGLFFEEKAGCLEEEWAALREESGLF